VDFLFFTCSFGYKFVNYKSNKNYIFLLQFALSLPGERAGYTSQFFRFPFIPAGFYREIRTPARNKIQQKENILNRDFFCEMENPDSE
jgi:hypothetical protein